jgi:16S rRNA A1518/A1519 N6-dimethyltransferase RsmA/KsgA/DIM1 with predicted DNA glycosylase/AP lyase activity
MRYNIQIATLIMTSPHEVCSVTPRAIPITPPPWVLSHMVQAEAQSQQPTDSCFSEGDWSSCSRPCFRQRHVMARHSSTSCIPPQPRQVQLERCRGTTSQHTGHWQLARKQLYSLLSFLSSHLNQTSDGQVRKLSQATAHSHRDPPLKVLIRINTTTKTQE